MRSRFAADIPKMARARKETVVIGLGNLLLGDEGAGVHALRLLRTRLNRQLVDLVEGGTPGPALLSQMQDRNTVYFLDAGNIDAAPGTFARFTPHQVESRRPTRGFSLHEFDLVAFTQWAGPILDMSDDQIVIYCIQAEQTDMRRTLSPAVEKGLPAMIDAVARDVASRTIHA